MSAIYFEVHPKTSTRLMKNTKGGQMDRYMTNADNNMLIVRTSVEGMDIHWTIY